MKTKLEKKEIEEKCHKIYDMVKEAWTPDHRTFEEAEADSKQPDKEVYTTCDGCQMFAECGCMLDDSCPECVEHHLWTPREQPDIDMAEMSYNEHFEQPGKSAEEPSIDQLIPKSRLLIKDGIEWIPIDTAKQAMQEYHQQGMPKLTKCYNCGEIVKMISKGEFCPKCYVDQ